MKYKIVALCGKAGSGKDTILRNVVSAAPEVFNEIISCTTRPKREGEVEGVNYFYLSDADFQNLETAGQMLETTEFNGWRYGTGLFTLSRDKVNIGVFNPAGLRTLRSNPSIDLDIYYIVAPDKARLYRQLHRENNPNCREICRRFMADEEDFYNLVNEFSDIIMLYNSEGRDLEPCTNEILGRYCQFK